MIAGDGSRGGEQHRDVDSKQKRRNKEKKAISKKKNYKVRLRKNLGFI